MINSSRAADSDVFSAGLTIHAISLSAKEGVACQLALLQEI